MMSGILPPVLNVIAPSPSLVPNDLSPATRETRSHFQVGLVSMPFVTILRPSIQLGLLKAIAVSQAFPVTVFNLNLDFAKQIDTSVYEAISESGRSFVGDWLFAAAAFGYSSPSEEEAFLDEYASSKSLLSTRSVKREYLLEIRRKEVPEYIDRLMAEIEWDRFRVVGFTSTFQQNAASIALATRLKKTYPSLTLIFGGSNCEGEMGL